MTEFTWLDPFPESMDAWVKVARDNPEEIVNIFHYATVEVCGLDRDFLEAIVRYANFDVNRLDVWPNDLGSKTTLLLSCVEFRNIPMIELLLELGANVNIRDEKGFGIIDTIVLGHSANDTAFPEQCVDILKIILPYGPQLRLTDWVHEELMDSENLNYRWYRECDELMKLLDQCVLSSKITERAALTIQRAFKIIVSKKRIQKRNAIIFQELMETVWAPHRVTIDMIDNF